MCSVNGYWTKMAALGTAWIDVWTDTSHYDYELSGLMIYGIYEGLISGWIWLGEVMR